LGIFSRGSDYDSDDGKDSYDEKDGSHGVFDFLVIRPIVSGVVTMVYGNKTMV